MILFTMYVFFAMDMMGMGEKKTEKYIYTKNKEKFPVWFPSHPPVYKIGGRLFFQVEETRNEPDLP